MTPILTAAGGYVLGTGAKIFTIAGAVIVYGAVASCVCGGYLSDEHKRLDQFGQAFASTYELSACETVPQRCKFLPFISIKCYFYCLFE